MNEAINLSDKDVLDLRNEIFLSNGNNQLEKKGFRKLPFITACFGRDNYGNYSYQYCRLVSASQLQILSVEITSGDFWIKLFLNIFTLKPEISSIGELKGVSGLKFVLPPNNTTVMRLRSDDYQGIPLFHLFKPKHKLKKFSSESGKRKEVQKLGKLIKKDIENIDFFIKRWHELHSPHITSWEEDII